MLQVVDEVLANPADTTKVSLVFGNVSEADILLKKEIDARAKAHPKQFSVHYVVDKATSSSWTGGVGYVAKSVLLTPTLALTPTPTLALTLALTLTP